MAGLTEDQKNALKSDGDDEQPEGAVSDLTDDTIIDGRISGVPPNYRRDELESDSSAAEADERNRQEGR